MSKLTYWYVVAEKEGGSRIAVTMAVDEGCTILTWKINLEEDSGIKVLILNQFEITKEEYEIFGE